MNENKLLKIVVSLSNCLSNEQNAIKLLYSISNDRLESIAANTATENKIIELLAKHKSSYIRAAVAYNIAAPLEVIKILACDSSAYVRDKVSQNPSTPQDTVNMLANDADLWVRHFALQNRNYTPKHENT